MNLALVKQPGDWPVRSWDMYPSPMRRPSLDNPARSYVSVGPPDRLACKYPDTTEQLLVLVVERGISRFHGRLQYVRLFFVSVVDQGLSRTHGRVQSVRLLLLVVSEEVLRTLGPVKSLAVCVARHLQIVPRLWTARQSHTGFGPV